jgi:lipoate-protein ligase A
MTATNTMSAEHKAALADGRNQSKTVRRFLEALDAHKPKRGRKRTPESIKKRLAVVEEEIPNADPLTKLSLIQERLDLTEELERLEETPDLDNLKEAFVEVAKDYSDRKGVTYDAWRAVGVDPATLKEAGISRSN